MTLSVPALLAPLTTASTLTWARLVTIERTDGTALRYTDHDQAIILTHGTGTVGRFATAHGLNLSADAQGQALSAGNAEAEGIIDDAAISEGDLRAGLYEGATVTTALVNWRYPWVGTVALASFEIGGVSYDGQVWRAELADKRARLAQAVGGQYTATCRWGLGDGSCGVALGSFTGTGTVSGTTSRAVFASTLTHGTADAYAFGQLTWATGSNAGLKSDVKASGTDGAFTLRLAVPHDIGSGDTFTVYAGCDKRFSTCVDIFSNGARFGGFPTIPGPDDVNGRLNVRDSFVSGAD